LNQVLQAAEEVQSLGLAESGVADKTLALAGHGKVFCTRSLGIKTRPLRTRPAKCKFPPRGPKVFSYTFRQVFQWFLTVPPLARPGHERVRAGPKGGRRCCVAVAPRPPHPDGGGRGEGGCGGRGCPIPLIHRENTDGLGV